MEHTKYARGLVRAAAAGAVLLTAMRLLVMKTAFDEDGLLPRGSLALPLTVLICVCVFAGLCVLAFRLNRLPGTEACFTRRRPWQLIRLAAAALLFAGSVVSWLRIGQTVVWSEPGQAGEKLQAASALVGMIAALTMAWTVLVPGTGAPRFWLRLPLALVSGMLLVMHFRDWSHDPMVLHIAPALLAWTCCMVGAMLLTAFPLNAGHRRSAALFGLAAGVFTCMELADCLTGVQTDLAALLTLLGIAIWCVSHGAELLRREVQEEEAPEPPMEAPAEAAVEPPAEAETSDK